MGQNRVLWAGGNSILGMKLSAYVLVHASIYLLHRRPLLRVDIPAAREEFLVRVRIRVRVRVRARIRARARGKVRARARV